MDQYTKDLEKRVEELESKIGAFNSIQKVVEIIVTRVVNKETSGTKYLEFSVSVKRARVMEGYLDSGLHMLCRAKAVGFDRWEIDDEFMDPEFFTQKSYECTETAMKETILKRLGLAAYEYTYNEVSDTNFPELCINDIVGVQPMTQPIGKVFNVNYTNKKPTVGGFSKITMPIIRSAYGKKK